MGPPEPFPGLARLPAQSPGGCGVLPPRGLPPLGPRAWPARGAVWLGVKMKIDHLGKAAGLRGAGRELQKSRASLLF